MRRASPDWLLAARGRARVRMTSKDPVHNRVSEEESESRDGIALLFGDRFEQLLMKEIVREISG